MTVYQNQDFWVTGTRFYFQRDPIDSVRQPIIDFGCVNTANPNFDNTTIQLYCGDGGVRRLVDEKIIQSDETYDIECFNISPEMKALLFLSSPPAELTQAASAKTDIKHYAHPGRLLKILDTDYDSGTATTDPRKSLGVASISSINSAVSGGGTAYTENTDWEWVSEERGLIRMISGGGFASAGELYITFTPRAISGERLITPTSGFTTAINGDGMLVWGRNNNAQQTARIARMSITPSAANFQIEDYSTMTLQAKVLSDIAKTEPAGRIEYWLGDLPSSS